AERPDRRVVGAPAPGDPQHDQEERGGIDAAVVRAGAALGALPEPRATGQPHLVEDLAGLLVVPRVDGRALPGGEAVERVEQALRREGPSLVGGDQAVAAEQRTGPREAGGQQGPLAG